mgnify:CR=1 FL=1
MESREGVETNSTWSAQSLFPAIARHAVFQAVGDNPNAGADPEVIAPLLQLQAMLPAGGGLQNV